MDLTQFRHLAGQHDQSTHSRKHGHGLGDMAGEPKAGAALFDKVRAEGGFTYHTVDHFSPHTGIMVSPYPERSRSYDVSRLKPDDIRHYAKSNADLLGKTDHFLGGWLDTQTGKVWLDVSIRTKTVAQAKGVGQRFNQIAAWDLRHGREVRLGGTGEAL